MKKQVLFVVLILFAFASCKKDDPAAPKVDHVPTYSIENKVLALYSKGTSQIKIKEESTEIFTYSSNNEFVATVGSDGLITAKRVGKTFIRVSYNNYRDSCQVVVLPLYNIFIEPITEFGISKTDVKAKEKRSLVDESDSLLIYSGGIMEKNVAYLFGKDGLTSSLVILSSQYSSDLGSYMAERYVMISLSPVLGYNVEKRFTVGTQLRTNLDWWVLYIPYTGNKSTIIKSHISEVLCNIKSELIKFNKYKM